VFPTTNPNVSLVYYGTKVGQHFSNEEPKTPIISDIKRYQAANNMTETTLEFIAFSNHSPYNMMVGSEATRDGFYKHLYGLQTSITLSSLARLRERMTALLAVKM
jgi:hypothetical protein